MKHSKQLLLVVLLIVSAGRSFSQTAGSGVNKTATFCKVWGFLKYYHPVVSQGRRDWDLEFISRIKELKVLESKQEISAFYIDWIDSLGSIPFCDKCDNHIPDSMKFNLNIDWIEDSSLFTSELISRLQFIRDNRNQEENYYVQQFKSIGNTSYKNEKEYKDSVFPTSELRLLGLSRYWNIINYYYPYKYLIGEDWNEVLIEMIPKFESPGDTIAYHMAMLEIVTKINDSHAFFVSHYTNQYFGYKWVPFRFKIIENKVIVTQLYNDSLCKIDDIRLNDVILSVGDNTIEEKINLNSKYVPASNNSSRLRDFRYEIFNGSTDSVLIKFERNGIVSEKIVHRYYFREFNFKYTQPKIEKFKILEGNIGYVNLGPLKIKDVKKILNKLKNTRAIIFDVRNYPDGTMNLISDFINSKKQAYVKFTVPLMSYPGVFKFEPAYYTGRNNKKYYKGKVVVLFNEYTQSHAEFTVMALQTAPDVTCIGSQTAGADGNISRFVFPGGYKTIMTGLGVYYPDWSETQRIGIVPDIVVKPTIEGIRMGKDEVLEKALEFLNSK